MCDNHKNSQLRAKNQSSGQDNLIINAIFYEDERLVWDECLWRRGRVLISRFRLPVI